MRYSFLATLQACRVLFILPVLLSIVPQTLCRAQDASESRTLILAHYMPWFAAKPYSDRWGWHWTMNVFDPSQGEGRQQPLASHYHPLIGAYDSSDPAVIEYHLLLMKVAGVDGVIVDWYGLTGYRDYAMLHRNTQKLVEKAGEYGMKVLICYEDQTVPALVEGGQIPDSKRVEHVVGELNWLSKHWFRLPQYVKLDGKPVLLSFGQSGLSDDEWTQCLTNVEQPLHYFSQHHKRTAAIGAFDWPAPNEGLPAVERFLLEARAWKSSLPVAFPRFVDIYAEAKVHESWGRIEDNQGVTFRESLKLAFAQQAPIVQLATWNDWGEGTMIEPSHEFGYRDLQLVQYTRRAFVDPQFEPDAKALSLPLKIYQLRKQTQDTTAQTEADKLVKMILVNGQPPKR